MKLPLSAFRVREEKLQAFGFTKTARGGWKMEAPLPVGGMVLSVGVRAGEVSCRVLDDSGEEYVMHQIAGAQGSFVGEVRAGVEAFRKEFVEACCVPEVFHGRAARALVEFAEKRFGERLEFLWNDLPRTAIVRRADNRKWYAVFMVLPPTKLGLPEGREIEVVNMRVVDGEPRLDGERFFPGWHMNKKTWFTAVLDGRIAKRELQELLLESRGKAFAKASK